MGPRRRHGLIARDDAGAVSLAAARGLGLHQLQFSHVRPAQRTRSLPCERGAFRRGSDHHRAARWAAAAGASEAAGDDIGALSAGEARDGIEAAPSMMAWSELQF